MAFALVNELKVLALTKYGPLAASTRQRFIQFEPALASAGIMVTHSPLLDDAHVQRLTDGKRTSPFTVASAYARRLAFLLGAGRFDALWIHCELFPYLPGGIERLAFMHRQPVIFDFDDAIFHMYDLSPNAVVRRLLGGKLVPLIRGAAAVCAGNDYLQDYAARVNSNAIVLPTVVDTDQYVPTTKRGERPLTVGWIGSPSTWAFVRPLLPLLAGLCRDHGIHFSAVGAGAAAEADRFDGLTFTPWSKANEIEAVQAMDIGIMPLPDEPWARGKCGYKLIQYMACGLPVVASPVGVNSSIVRAGENGLLASSQEEWRAALESLIADPQQRATMGAKGRALIVDEFSLTAQAGRVVTLFEDVTDTQRSATQAAIASK